MASAPPNAALGLLALVAYRKAGRAILRPARFNRDRFWAGDRAEFSTAGARRISRGVGFLLAQLVPTTGASRSRHSPSACCPNDPRDGGFSARFSMAG